MFCALVVQLSAGYRISSNRSQGLTANTIELMVLIIGLWCVASFVTYYSTYWYFIMASDVQKSVKLKLKAGEPGGSNRSRVSNTSRVSNRSWGSDGIVLIQAGGFC